MNIDLCRTVKLPQIGDKRGSLSYAEFNEHVPFLVRRIYYLFSVPVGQKRGFHSHVEMEAFMLPINGEFVLTLDDGKRRKQFEMTDRSVGVYIAPGIWRELSDFSSDAVCLVLASTNYTESDYIRNYEQFLGKKHDQNSIS